MFQKLIKFFKGPTPEEAYRNGRRCVMDALNSVAPEGKREEANHLYAMASGGFNSTAAHRAFDQGVRDKLAALGYESDY